MVAAVIGLLGLVPGMPHLVFWAAPPVWAGWRITYAPEGRAQRRPSRARPKPPPGPSAAGRGGQLRTTCSRSTRWAWRSATGRSRWSTRSAAATCSRASAACGASSRRRSGFLPPVVHARDNLELQAQHVPPDAARRGHRRGRGLSGHVPGDQSGPCADPAERPERHRSGFGLPAIWIDERQRETAQMAGYTVVDCSTVVATIFHT